MNRFVFNNLFQDEEYLNGIPKIALRKSETKTLKSPLTPLYERGGWAKKMNVAEVFRPPYFISSFSKGGLRKILGSLVLRLLEGLLLCIKTKKLKRKLR